MSPIKKILLVLTLIAGVFLIWSLFLDPYSDQFDAEYVGNQVCAECHSKIYPEWKRSPHANMTRDPTPESVVGNFDGGNWMLPENARRAFGDDQPAAKMYQQDGKYFMALRHPASNEFVPFEIAYVVGYQYRQVYVTLEKGPAMSVCARCHGSDILLGSTDIYRIYEPGRSREGRTNDLSDYFQQTPLTPGRTFPTVEVYADGEPKGIGTLFRSLIESACYQQAEIRCFDCHNPHDNKQAAVQGILHPSEASNQYCLGCHQDLAEDLSAHTHHEQGEQGSFCYNCHMPRTLTKLASGTLETTRTHKMSSIPHPENSLKHGLENSPNACNLCHADQSVQWSADQLQQWFGSGVSASPGQASFITPVNSGTPTKPGTLVKSAAPVKMVPIDREPTPQPGKPLAMNNEEQLEFAINELAGRLNIERQQIRSLGLHSVTWRSSATGCPKPGMSYMQSLVPGVLINLEAAGNSFRYHATTNGQPFYCPASRAETPAQGGALE